MTSPLVFTRYSFFSKSWCLLLDLCMDWQHIIQLSPQYRASVHRLLPLPPPIFKSKKKFNGKAKFLFRYNVAARVWGTDQIVIKIPVWLKQPNLFSVRPFHHWFPNAPPFCESRDQRYWGADCIVIIYVESKKTAKVENKHVSFVYHQHPWLNNNYVKNSGTKDWKHRFCSMTTVKVLITVITMYSGPPSGRGDNKTRAAETESYTRWEIWVC